MLTRVLTKKVVLYLRTISTGRAKDGMSVIAFNRYGNEVPYNKQHLYHWILIWGVRNICTTNEYHYTHF